MVLRIGSASQRGSISTPDKVAAIAGIVGMVTGALGIGFNVAGSRAADQTDARSAREVVIAEALQMAEYDADSGVARQNEIAVLGADVEQLADEYGQSRLHLSATLYRMAAQDVTYSTTDLALADKLLTRAVDAAATGSLELVQVERVRGDLAAQRQQPAAMEAAYDKALQLSADLSEPEPAVDTYTRAYRLIDAYLGANRSPAGSPVRRQFCALAGTWSADLPLVRAMAGRPLVSRQLSRVSVSSVDALAAICA